MNLERFIDNTRRDLAAAAEIAGPDVRAAADRMLTALEPALRLAALDLLSQAADEITAALPAGEVAVRLRGREPTLVVEPPAPAGQPARQPAGLLAGQAARQRATLLVEQDVEEDEDPLVRVSLRIPESIKARAEEEANRSGLSLNAWIVGVLRASTWRRAVTPDVDLTSIAIEATPRSR